MGRLIVRKDERAWEAVAAIAEAAGYSHIRMDSVSVVRSNSSARAYARIWGVGRVLQVGLGIGPAYVIELVEPNFSTLPCWEKIRIIVHELAHIPTTFSGYVMAHTPVFRARLRKGIARVSRRRDELKRSVCHLL